MRTGGVFHPNFFYAPRNTLETADLVKLKIYKLTPNAAEWTPGVGMSATPDTLVWEGRGRFQPNKDWRSRPREVQFEYDAIQAVRIQIPIGKNLVGAMYNMVEKRYVSYGADPEFVKDMRVEVVDGPVIGFDSTEGKNLYIRNAIQNQNLWHYNLLCDTKTGAQGD